MLVMLFVGDWEALQAKHILRVQSLALAFSLVQAPLVNIVPLGASQVLVPPTHHVNSNGVLP
jgi:hypothetical protein